MLMCSAPIRSSTRPASNTGSQMIVAPRSRPAMMPALYPKVWKKGLTTR